MLGRGLIAAAALATLMMTTGAAQAFEDSKYPNLKGLWTRSVQGAPRFDTSKPRGLPQQAPFRGNRSPWFFHSANESS